MDTMFEINRQRDALDNKKRYDILAIGDSHIRVFEHKLFSIFTNKKIKIVYVPGASSYGILNSNSLTGAYKKIEEALEENIYDKIIITLGEVDCSYTLWMLAENKQRDIDELLDISISRYITFLEKIKKYAPLYVLSASLPTIRDFENCDDSISGIRKKIDIPQYKRSELTLKFNQEISNFISTQRDISFIDFTNLLYSKKRKVVRSFILNNKKSCDHHYKRFVYALLLLWRTKCLKF